MAERNLRAINYFGSKVSNAHRYPEPRHDLVIEPFAGGAGYALLHKHKSVLLLDKSADVIGAWQFLIEADPADVEALPLIEEGQDVQSLDCSPGGRLLISWCLNQTATPRRKASSWAKFWSIDRDRACYWGKRRRSQAAHIAGEIKHWCASVGSYESAPNVEATWFIDPPYVDGGRAYPHHDIDYSALAGWCTSRRGQTIVCERQGADWLPFEPLYGAPTARRYLGGARRNCGEAVWVSGGLEQGSLF